MAWLNQFRTGNSADLEYRKKVIELFVNAIYIYDNKIKMFFNVTDSAQITYPEMLALEESESSDLVSSGVPDVALSERTVFVNGVIGIIVHR